MKEVEETRTLRLAVVQATLELIEHTERDEPAFYGGEQLKTDFRHFLTIA